MDAVRQKGDALIKPEEADHKSAAACEGQAGRMRNRSIEQGRQHMRARSECMGEDITDAAAYGRGTAEIKRPDEKKHRECKHQPG